VNVYDQFLHMLILQGLDTMNPILVLNGIKLVRNLLVKGDMDELIVGFDTMSLSYWRLQQSTNKILLFVIRKIKQKFVGI